jgi:hypothetical protein
VVTLVAAGFFISKNTGCFRHDSSQLNSARNSQSNIANPYRFFMCALGRYTLERTSRQPRRRYTTAAIDHWKRTGSHTAAQPT